MYEVAVYFRRTDRGGIEFIPDAEANEDCDATCELRVRFKIHDIYPAEADTGAGMDWDGDIDTISMRTDEFPRWSRLRDEDFVAAKAFLLREHGDALWDAGYDYAKAVHYGEVA